MSRLTLDLSPAAAKTLTEIAKREKITKAETMRRAFALLVLSEAEKENGNSLAVVRKNENDPAKYEIIARVVGA